MNTDHRRAHAQHGFSLIEIMIGIVIGMIAVLVIYQVFALAEGIKRNTTSVGDAQQNGLLSSFILNVQLANANNGYAYAMKELGTCTPTANPATTFRPIPVLITPGALATDPCAWTNPDAPPMRHSLMRPVSRALDALPTQFSAVVRLVDLEERSYKDAASELAVPVGTVMSRLFRGRRLLAEALAEPIRVPEAA